MGCADGSRWAEAGMHEELRRTTKLLCEANALIDNFDSDGTLRSVELITWWSEHQECDKKRIKDEEHAANKLKLISKPKRS